MVVALAGRRIDAEGATSPRFPLQNVRLVEQRLRAFLQSRRTSALVSSAACGADLVAQTVAGALGPRRRVILPFDRQRFRSTSVTDGPGEWGPLYDRLLNQLDVTGDVVTIESHGGDEGRTYALANLAILDHALAIGSEAGQELLAVLVWEGASRGPDDLTAAFGKEARQRGVQVMEINTLQ